MFAPEVRHHLGTWREGSEGIVTGQQILTDNLQDIFRTFPDWKMEIVEMVAEGESVVVRCRVSGTHLGSRNQAGQWRLLGWRRTDSQAIRGSAHSLVQGSRRKNH